MKIDLNKCYTSQELQKALRIGKTTLYARINQGLLPKPGKWNGISIWVKSNEQIRKAVREANK